jgi:hypothetical protein
MVQIYIKHTDNNFYLLDVDENELINLKFTFKDLNDISKIFAPFTQSFTLKATDKNKILSGFYGNEKIQRPNLTGEFDSKIYIAGFLFQSGKLTFKESDYEFQNQKVYKASFASNLTSLSEILGDTTIQSLFQKTDGSFDTEFLIDFNTLTLNKLMSSIKSVDVASTNINLKFAIPFISNKRVWIYDEENLKTVDNIAFQNSRTIDTVNQIELDEIRPAINYKCILEYLILKIGVPIICPLFDRPELLDIFTWCSAENIVTPNTKASPLVNYNNIIAARTDFKRDTSAVSVPQIENVKWLMTSNSVTGIFKCKRNNANSGEQGGWSDGFDVNVIFNNLISLQGAGTKIKVNLINAETNILLDSQEITGNVFTSRITDTRAENPTMLNSNGELFMRIEVLPLTLLAWNNLNFQTVQRFNYTRRVTGFKRTARANYSHTSLNSTASATLGGNKFNLITALPKIKSADFLRSFFKTFNISVVATGLPDQSMYWLTPSDIQEKNKEWSTREVDYTEYTDIATLNKKEGNEYNQYLFSHAKSKYFDSETFGSLIFPEAEVLKPTKFEIKTDYSIMNVRNLAHPSSVKTAYGFANETPEVLNNGAVRYKPVFEEFTLFYLQANSLGASPFSLQFSNTQNQRLFQILQPSYVNFANRKTLAFGAIGIDTDSLYLNYYSEFIELLLNPNTYKSEFIVNLPANEIFLNFANTKQGESNIPTGFRMQNQIIIGNQRYFFLDAQINLTDGRTKLIALNF